MTLAVIAAVRATTATATSTQTASSGAAWGEVDVGTSNGLRRHRERVTE
jgi:hypothetical protein